MGNRNGSAWLSHEIGGLPAWGMGLVAAALAACGVIAATNQPEPPTTVAAPVSGDATPTTTLDQALDSGKTYALFIGDSYSAGKGSSDPAYRWTTLVSLKMGWVENNLALGGTGYVATSGMDGCGLEYCAAYDEVIAQNVQAKPDVVVISGGRNDGDRLDEGSVEKTILDATQQWPDARILVTSPLWDDDEAPRWFDESLSAVRDAVAATQVSHLDLGQPLFDRSDYIISDGVHPSDAGHAAIAEAFIAAYPPA